MATLSLSPALGGCWHFPCSLTHALRCTPPPTTLSSFVRFLPKMDGADFPSFVEPYTASEFRHRPAFLPCLEPSSPPTALGEAGGSASLSRMLRILSSPPVPVGARIGSISCKPDLQQEEEPPAEFDFVGAAVKDLAIESVSCSLLFSSSYSTPSTSTCLGERSRIFLLCTKFCSHCFICGGMPTRRCCRLLPESAYSWDISPTVPRPDSVLPPQLLPMFPSSMSVLQFCRLSCLLQLLCSAPPGCTALECPTRPGVGRGVALFAPAFARIRVRWSSPLHACGFMFIFLCISRAYDCVGAMQAS